jgi:hypothetical protein
VLGTLGLEIKERRVAEMHYPQKRDISTHMDGKALIHRSVPVWGRRMGSKISATPISATTMCAHKVLVFAAFISCPIATHAAPLNPEEAGSHVGENATVCGVVASATYAAQAPMAPTFLDLGKPYPNQVFSVIIFGSDRPKFGAPETSMRDKPVCITGEIFLYEGKPRIILRDPMQLSGR